MTCSTDNIVVMHSYYIKCSNVKVGSIYKARGVQKKNCGKLCILLNKINSLMRFNHVSKGALKYHISTLGEGI